DELRPTRRKPAAPRAAKTAGEAIDGCQRHAHRRVGPQGSVLMRAAIARSYRVAAGSFALLSVLVAFPALAAESSAAASSGAAQPMEIARARYRQGVEAYKAGHYRESIDYFLEADRASPSAALSFNIAVAYEKIDDVAAALRWYRDYLRRAPDAKDRAGVEG